MSGRNCLIRFHKPNPSGRSFNYRDRVWEKGNCVYKAVHYDTDGEYHLILPPCVSSAQTLITLVSNVLMHKQPIYEVTGDILPDTGTEGEPLLKSVRILKELTIRDGIIKAL